MSAFRSLPRNKYNRFQVQQAWALSLLTFALLGHVEAVRDTADSPGSPDLFAESKRLVSGQLTEATKGVSRAAGVASDLTQTVATRLDTYHQDIKSMAQVMRSVTSSAHLLRQNYLEELTQNEEDRLSPLNLNGNLGSIPETGNNAGSPAPSPPVEEQEDQSEAPNPAPPPIVQTDSDEEMGEHSGGLSEEDSEELDPVRPDIGRPTRKPIFGFPGVQARMQDAAPGELEQLDQDVPVDDDFLPSNSALAASEERTPMEGEMEESDLHEGDHSKVVEAEENNMNDEDFVPGSLDQNEAGD